VVWPAVGAASRFARVDGSLAAFGSYEILQCFSTHFMEGKPPMNHRPCLALDDVKCIAQAAEAEALRNNWAVTLAVVDDGGHLLWLQRLDGAPPISAHIAPAKARTAALGRRESRLYEETINQGRVAFLSAPLLDGMLEGGVPIIAEGHCIGAVGVSGVKSSEDVEIARAGIAALIGR
jgi:glc operon protein GlcG